MQHQCCHCGETCQALECPSCGNFSLLNGRYGLQHRLGSGGIAETWKALDHDSTNMVAIKELPWRLDEGSKAQSRFFREAELLRQISNPAVPAYIDHFVTQNGRHRTLHIVQEYIDGPSLLEELAERRFSQAEVWEMALELLTILEFIHTLSPAIIHRDIKPSNIMRHPDGHLLLIDFGAARDTITEAGLGASTISGTFGYMSPEQLQGYATPRSDLYSVGALLVHLLVRRPPSELTNHRLEIHWRAHLELPEAFGLFLDGLIHTDSRKRHPSAAQAKAVLDAALNPPQNAPTVNEHNALLEAVRSMLRDELQQRPPQPQQHTTIETSWPTALAESHELSVNESKKVVTETDAPPAPLQPMAEAATLLVLPEHRRGWWKPQPLTEEQRSRPMHPATQISMMSAGMVVVAFIVQTLFVWLLG